MILEEEKGGGRKIEIMEKYGADGYRDLIGNSTNRYKSGFLITMASTTGAFDGNALMTGYCTSKAAMIKFHHVCLPPRNFHPSPRD